MLPATSTGTKGGSASKNPSTLRRLGNVFRPQGPKVIQTGITWAKGQQTTLNGQVDLSTPVIGFRFVLKGRIAIGTAAYTSVKPEQLLNLLKEVKITGVNSRANGNVTLFDMDSASWCGFRSLFVKRGYYYFVNKAAAGLNLNPTPTTPYFGSAGFTGFDGTVNNFDFIIEFDVPMFPLISGDGYRPGWALRSSEWRDSLQIIINFASLPDNAENEIGVSAATSVTTLSAYQSATGSPTLDVYSLTSIMGLDLAPTVLPGVLSRAAQPLTSVVQTTGTNVALIPQLQKQITGRVYIKTGVSTLSPFFSSLSDSVLTAAAIVVGANRNVRNLVDWFAHKMELAEEYLTDPIQGYLAFDFLQSDSPFSAYPGQTVGAGATFQLIANVTGAANQSALIVQSQHLFEPSGPAYGT